jgi:hypothetical protein
MENVIYVEKSYEFLEGRQELAVEVKVIEGKHRSVTRKQYQWKSL